MFVWYQLVLIKAGTCHLPESGAHVGNAHLQHDDLPPKYTSLHATNAQQHIVIHLPVLQNNNTYNNIDVNITYVFIMALSILKNRYSLPKTATSSISTYSDDNNKSRRQFRSASSTSVEFINVVRAILGSFHDLVVGILLIAFALPFFYVIGIWLGTNVNLSTGDTIIEHTTIELRLQNHRIKDETAPCGAHKVRRNYIRST